jgi:hypothetical protein
MDISKKCITGLLVVISVGLLSFCGCISDNINETNVSSSQYEDTNSSSVKPFDYPPFDLEKVAFIFPMGGMIGSHVTPIDHLYYVSYDFELGNDAAVDINVYAPGNGTVTSIQHMSVAAGDTPIVVDDYRLVVKHSSTTSSIYIHIDELSDKLAAVDPGLGEYASVNVQVSAGEVIGTYGGSVDYNIVDEEVTLDFINPESYASEPWKIHCPDPFDYFNSSIRNIMVEKCLRSHEPIGGKICYDREGRLVGTWFEEGTNGYAGIDQNRYWAGHLSIAYDSIDPDAIVVSIGTYIDSARQFCVKGNAPNPANISVNELVVYELTDIEYMKNETMWDRNNLVKGLKISDSEHVQGVILLQLVEDRKVKVELFPGKTGTEVQGFTDNFRFYVR